MKKHYKFEIDCANCAAKVEDAIKKIDGVNNATVSFMTQKLTLDADDARFDEILQQGRGHGARRLSRTANCTCKNRRRRRVSERNCRTAARCPGPKRRIR